MEKDPVFVNRVVRQGNSLCVRIPSNIVKEEKLSEGDEVSVTLQRVSWDLNTESLEGFIDVVNKIPDLNKFSQLQKKLFAIISFQLNKDSLSREEDASEKKKVTWLKKLGNELGSDFMEDFVDFAQLLNDRGFDVGKDGVPVLKKKFR